MPASGVGLRHQGAAPERGVHHGGAGGHGLAQVVGDAAAGDGQVDPDGAAQAVDAQQEVLGDVGLVFPGRGEVGPALAQMGVVVQDEHDGLEGLGVLLGEGGDLHQVVALAHQLAGGTDALELVADVGGDHLRVPMVLDLVQLPGQAQAPGLPAHGDRGLHDPALDHALAAVAVADDQQVTLAGVPEHVLAGLDGAHVDRGLHVGGRRGLRGRGGVAVGEVAVPVLPGGLVHGDRRAGVAHLAQLLDGRGVLGDVDEGVRDLVGAQVGLHGHAGATAGAGVDRVHGCSSVREMVGAVAGPHFP